MKRDMELIRQIMLNVEGGDLRGGVEGYDHSAVNYHKVLLIEADLLKGKTHYSVSTEPRDIPDGVIIKKITWQGHDFIEAIRTDTKWNKIKAFLSEAGKDLTIETIKFGAQRLFGIAGE